MIRRAILFNKRIYRHGDTVTITFDGGSTLSGKLSLEAYTTNYPMMIVDGVDIPLLNGNITDITKHNDGQHDDKSRQL